MFPVVADSKKRRILNTCDFRLSGKFTGRGTKSIYVDAIAFTRLRISSDEETVCLVFLLRTSTTDGEENKKDNEIFHKESPLSVLFSSNSITSSGVRISNHSENKESAPGLTADS